MIAYEDEDDLRRKWSASICLSDASQAVVASRRAPSEPRRNQEKARKAVARNAQAWKQKYAEVCVPRLEGDEYIIKMFGEGYPLRTIATEDSPIWGISYDAIRKRLVACHPQGMNFTRFHAARGNG